MLLLLLLLLLLMRVITLVRLRRRNVIIITRWGVRDELVTLLTLITKHTKLVCERGPPRPPNNGRKEGVFFDEW